MYAGSLVNPGHLKRCRPEAELHDSARMNLEEQVEVMARGVLEGKKVVRLHTGDPSMYGAIAEQFDLLDKKGIESIVVPGVSSVFAAAAALRTELTYPGLAQSLVLTRTPGRTPMPSGRNLRSLCRNGRHAGILPQRGQAGRTGRTAYLRREIPRYGGGGSVPRHLAG